MRMARGAPGSATVFNRSIYKELFIVDYQCQCRGARYFLLSYTSMMLHSFSPSLSLSLPLPPSSLTPSFCNSYPPLSPLSPPIFFGTIDAHARWLATSQMQPTDARRALPCFDEPDLRAIFYTEIEHRSDMVALSNGIDEGERSGSNTGWVITTYRATPKMSTYLLAFVVGYFDKTEMYTENGVLVSSIHFK